MSRAFWVFSHTNEETTRANVLLESRYKGYGGKKKKTR